MRITPPGPGRREVGAVDPRGHTERTLAVLREYRTAMDAFEVARVRITATPAARDAANRDEFFGPATTIVGTAAEPPVGRGGGRLSLLGATTGLDPALGPVRRRRHRRGSTEFSLVDGGRSPSTPAGARLTEVYLESDPPAPEELSACVTVTAEYLKDVVRELPGVSEARTFVGLAGTVTSRWRPSASAWPPTTGMPSTTSCRPHEAAEDVFRTLATESRAQRVHNPGPEEAQGRRPSSVAAAACWCRSSASSASEECLVSEADILDGLILSQLQALG